MRYALPPAVLTVALLLAPAPVATGLFGHDGPSREPTPVSGSAAASADPSPTAGAESAAFGVAVADSSLRPRRAPASRRYTDPRIPFDVRVAGERVAHRLATAVTVPGGRVRIRVPKGREGVRLRHQSGAVEPDGTDAWVWTAPESPGIYAARVERSDGAAVDLTLVSAHPASHVEGGVLHGYRIGAYVSEPLRGLDAYRPPAAFVEVRSEDRDVLVSPHFTLGQFLCKQPGEPRFIALSGPLVRKLEAVLAAVNAEGPELATLEVMSGFRTPAYNRAIGNTTVYSRHLWGDAADIFVDRDGDGEMDDLNGDGRSSVADARVLSALVERVETAEAGLRPGGMGVYRRNAVHGPFVHVDARGYRARW